MKRSMLTCFAMLSLLAIIAGSIASPVAAAPGGNAQNAKDCQKGGWASLARTGDASTAFVSQDACVSYAAQGGTIVPYVAPTPVPPPTEVVLGTPCEEAAKAVGVDLSAYTLISGTEDDDTFIPTARPEVFCGFGGWDFIQELGGDDVFIGGGDRDDIESIDGGTFYGGDGDDNVYMISSGTFNGGSGDEHVDTMWGGTFNGGDGNDSVSLMELGGGTFNGGDGYDSVCSMTSGVVDSVEGIGVC